MTEVAESTIIKPTITAPWALANLPSFPVVATRLIALLSKEDVNIHEAGRIIAADPAFATRVLQMANSPLFALERQVKTISHAIVILGVQRVKAISLTRALGDFIGPALKVRALRVCWRNSLAGAILAGRLARACRLDPDTAYVAGLLRDLGRLALLVKYPDEYANLLAVSGENAFDLLSTERDLFDIDHCQAGAWLMETVPFPAELTEVVAHHHEVPTEPFRMVHLVRVADRLADTLGFAVVPPLCERTYAEAIEELPVAHRTRFVFDPDQLKLEIESKIQAWN